MNLVNMSLTGYVIKTEEFIEFWSSVRQWKDIMKENN